MIYSLLIFLIVTTIIFIMIYFVLFAVSCYEIAIIDNKNRTEEDKAYREKHIKKKNAYGTISGRLFVALIWLLIILAAYKITIFVTG